MKNVKQISDDFQGWKGCLQDFRSGPWNDLAWMPGLGVGHHGCVCDEFDAGAVLIAHRDG